MRSDYKPSNMVSLKEGQILLCHYPPADPTISASLNHSWPLELWLFSSPARGISHFFTDMQNTTEKRTNKQTRAWVSSKCKRGKSDTFYAFCELTWACTQAKTLTKPLAMLTYLLTLVHPAFVGQQVLTATFLTSVDWSPLCPTHLLTDLFCRQVSSGLFCWLCPSLDWPLQLGPSFLHPSGLLGDLAHRPFVWVSRQNRQRDSLTGTHRNGCHS